MLKRIPRRNHITPVFRELHWLKIHDINYFFCHTRQSVNNTAPDYLCDLIRFNSLTMLSHAFALLVCVRDLEHRVI